MFAWVDVIRDPHNTVDRFATSGNRQTERFNSKFWDVGTETTDVLTVNWETRITGGTRQLLWCVDYCVMQRFAIAVEHW